MVFSKVFVGFLTTFGKTKKQKKNNPISKGGSETFQTLFSWFSRRFFWFSFVFFCMFGFLEGFCWFCKNLRENQTTKKTNPISKGGSETFKNFVFLVFPKVLLVFFGFLLYFWFSRRFLLVFKKPSGKPKNQTRPNPWVSFRSQKFQKNIALLRSGVWNALRWVQPPRSAFTSPTVFG